MKFKLFIVCALFAVGVKAQERSYPNYPSPVKIPVYLSANFGELRSNSFHAGVDIKTQGVVGKGIYAVADGYVSRIGVSPFGYGKVLYITHNDGFMSVYAHMSKFNKRIDEYVKKKQYDDKSYTQTIHLEKDTFPVKRGDFIGYTGNTGSSTGPHLHYEIRYDDTQEPVNPMYFGLKINDDVKPIIKGLAVYPFDNSIVNKRDTSSFFNVSGKDGYYYLNDKIIKANGKIAFGINTYDKAGKVNNKYGAYSIELFANNQLIFSLIFDKYSYDETRYINSLIDYAHLIKNKERYIRTDIDPLNFLRLYEVRNGVLTVNEGDTIKMCFVVKDYLNNKSVLNFTIIGSELPNLRPQPIPDRSYYRVFNGDPVIVALDGFEAEIPEKAFYRDTYLKVKQLDTIEDIASDYSYIMGSNEIPVHKYITVRLRPKKEYDDNEQLFVGIKDKDNKISYLGCEHVGNYIEAKTRSLGTFVLSIDSLAPTIQPVNFKNKGKVSENQTIKIKIKDEDSGIDKYNLYLNGKWILAEYDAKNDLLIYNIDKRLKTGSNKLKLVVSDNVGNEKVYNAVIQR